MLYYTVLHSVLVYMWYYTVLHSVLHIEYILYYTVLHSVLVYMWNYTVLHSVLHIEYTVLLTVLYRAVLYLILSYHISFSLSFIFYIPVSAASLFSNGKLLSLFS